MTRRDGWLSGTGFLAAAALLAVGHSAAVAPLVAGL
ncbi:hypothetical protein FHT02_001178 [Sphingomonas xinjiangensis]|uniref:Uncharacterized protein n=1 Tax=Sphingomonas xinjiangensis TaxID=643568 RepID=A0A840YL64_9SPHN|nr:hypothetical protein [Sphingomonas xinjiangensis]